MFGKNTNKTNLKIARETNETNKQIMQMQLEANERLWNMSNEYNTMSAQRQRMSEAGYNPAAVLGNTQQVGPAESFDAIPAQRAEMKPYEMEYAMQAAGNLNAAAQTAANIKKTNAEAENIQIENVFKERLLDSQIGMNTASAASLNADVGVKQAIEQNTLTDTLQKELQYTFDSMPEVFNYKVANAHQQALLTEYNADLAKLQKEYQVIENRIQFEYGPKKAEVEIDEVKSQINQLNEQAKYWREMGKSQEWVRKHLSSEIGYLSSLSKYYGELTTRETLANGITANVYNDRIAEEHMQGQRARLQYFFDQQHYLDLLYNELRKSNYSVESAQYMVRQAKYAADIARQQNDWYATQQFMDVANTVGSLYAKGANVANARKAVDLKMQEFNAITEDAYELNTDYYNESGQKYKSVQTRSSKYKNKNKKFGHGRR